MIIETPFKDGDTVSFKLASGEEIVAKLDETKTNSYSLKKPMVLIMNQDGSMGLAPFMFSVSPDAKFDMLKSTISCMAKTEKEIANQYVATTTGVVLN